MKSRFTVGCSVALVSLIVGCGGGETPEPKSAADTSPSASKGGKGPGKTDNASADAGTANGSAANDGALPPPPHVAPGAALSDSRSDLDPAAKGAYEQALTQLAAGNLAGAKQSFVEATNKAPNSATARYALGSVLERAGDAAGAQAQYRKGLATNPSYEPAISALAMSLARNNHLSEAEAFVSDKFSRFPNSVAIATTLAEVKSLEDDHATAQRLVQEALKLRPDYVPAMVAIARDYFRAHQYDVARYALGVILDGSSDGSIPARDKDNAEAHLLRGLIERQAGERNAAMDDFAASAAASRSGDPFEALMNVGEMKLEAGNAREAVASLEKAVHLSPSSAVAHLDLGDCYRLLARAGDAKRELDAALALDSSLASGHYDLGLLYLYAPQVPGVAAGDEQIALAIKELGIFKSMQGARVRAGAGDDVDDLVTVAKAKQGELQVKKNAAAAAAAAPPAAAAPGTKPAAGAQPGTPPGTKAGGK